MKIAVCISSSTGIAVSESDASERRGRVGRSTLNPFDARAIEEALRIVEAPGRGGEVVLLAVAASSDLGAIRDGLARGADRAILSDGLSIEERDVGSVARTLAALVSSEAPDLVLLCYWPGDIEGPLLASALGEILDMPVITQARTVAVGENDVTVQKQVEGGDQTQCATMPCVVDLAESINKPRYPTIKGKVAAKAKPVSLFEAGGEGGAPQAPLLRLLAIAPAPRTRQRQIFGAPAEGVARVIGLLVERELLQ